MQPVTNTLLTETRNGVLTCAINRPAVRNAVDPQTMIALGDAVRACDEQSDVHVIVITGVGCASSAKMRHYKTWQPSQFFCFLGVPKVLTTYKERIIKRFLERNH